MKTWHGCDNAAAPQVPRRPQPCRRALSAVFVTLVCLAALDTIFSPGPRTWHAHKKPVSHHAAFAWEKVCRHRRPFLDPHTLTPPHVGLQPLCTLPHAIIPHPRLAQQTAIPWTRHLSWSSTSIWPQHIAFPMVASIFLPHSVARFHITMAWTNVYPSHGQPTRIHSTDPPN